MGVYADLQALAQRDPDQAARECVTLLDRNPDDSLALFLLGQIHAEAEHFGMAANVYRRVTQLKPEKSEGWNNLGMALEGLKRHQEAMQCFRKAWGLEARAAHASNIGNCYLSQQDYAQAVQWAHKALKIDAQCHSARAVLAMASLALNDWATGWDHYEATLGGKFRKEVQYQNEGRWDGTPGQSLIVYGEQGLGDEVMYASCIPDVARDNRVVLECDRRLEGLFRRSFPQVDVYGTRREAVDWLERYQFDARCSIGTLPKFFRRSAAAFPGAPYLKADPERVTQWEALFKRPTIGLCWSGGTKHNKREHRHIGLEAFRPLIEGLDADFVSLQDKDPTEEIRATGLPVKHYRRATETDDYDDTAGLVAALDMVIGVHTSAHHLAGALGVRGVILVPQQTLWLYAKEFPWYASAQLFRQRGTWTQTIQALVEGETLCPIKKRPSSPVAASSRSSSRVRVASRPPSARQPEPA